MIGERPVVSVSMARKVISVRRGWAWYIDLLRLLPGERLTWKTAVSFDR